MKRSALLASAVLCVASPLPAGAQASAGFMAGSCQTDEEIDAKVRGTIADAAMAYANVVIGPHPDPSAAYATMAANAQRTLSESQIASEIQGMNNLAPYTQLKVEHVYFLNTTGAGPDQRALCGPVRGDRWVAVEATPGVEQAYATVSAQSRNNGWALTLWLSRAGQEWRVENLHFGVAAIVGRSPDDFLTLARQERDAGHAFNAALLYVGVMVTVDRGLNFQLGLKQTLDADTQKFDLPSELKGAPPFAWKFGDHEWKVRSVKIGGVAGSLGLTFELPQDVWDGDDAVGKRNREFLDGFMKAHPEFSRVFGFLVAQAYKPDNSGGFSTVYEVGKGYD